MLNLEPYYKLVEEAIDSLGVSPDSCRTEKTGQWDMKKGSASIWIDVFLSKQNEEYGYLQIMSPIIRIPENRREEFFRELLEINYGLYGVSFNIYNDWVYLKVIRELENLDKEEAVAMLNRTGSYADDYDDYLKNKYVAPFTGSGGRAPSA
ncbi:MAG: YbjN domain-containing protein [Bernardetiaceae bacterium]|jgi:hypothetical protein|nr:YbjN domain-containing protein [Bernardetiaceae bacterium]